ncbi:MAG: ABC transporter substrate-binding protein [Pseudomonadota bacterium]
MSIAKRLTGLARKSAFVTGCIIGLSGIGTSSATAETIGVSLPLSGDATEFGQKFRTGAKLAMEQYGLDHQLFIADDGCDTDLGNMAAGDLSSQNPAIVIGMLCNAPAISIAGQMVESQVPVLISGARSVRLIKDRVRESWNLWRISPGDDYPVEVAANAIEKLWQTTPYAIVDDGTIYGRSFTDTLRIKMGEKGLEPQFSDTFRAAQSTQAGLLRRLQRSGITAVFIASASVEDLFTIARNMEEFDIDLDLIATEALGVLPFLEDAMKVPSGVKIVMAPPPEDAELNELLAQRDIVPDRQIYNGYAAIEIATTALGTTPEETTENLSTKLFDTVLGPIGFNQDGSSLYNPYGLYEWDGEKLGQLEQAAETQ